MCDPGPTGPDFLPAPASIPSSAESAERPSARRPMCISGPGGWCLLLPTSGPHVGARSPSLSGEQSQDPGHSEPQRSPREPHWPPAGRGPLRPQPAAPPAQGHRHPGTQPSAVLSAANRRSPASPFPTPPSPPSETWNEQSRPPSSSPASFPSCHEFSKCGRPRASCPVFDISSRGPCFRAPRRAQGYQELSNAVTVVVGLGVGALGRGSRAGETAPRQWGHTAFTGAST